MTYLLDFLTAHPCVDCGESDPVVLEFDHLADKHFDVGRALQNHAWDRLVAEIAKCEVRCANCHRRQTARRGGFTRTRLVDDRTSRALDQSGPSGSQAGDEARTRS